MGRPPKFCDEGCYAVARRRRRRRVPRYIYDAELKRTVPSQTMNQIKVATTYLPSRLLRADDPHW